MATVVRCGDCGAVLDERSNVPVERRKPCPSCGATSRKFEISLSATLKLVSSLGLEIRREFYERNWPWLVLVGALTLLGALVGGLVFSGWASVAAALGFGVATFYVSLRALTKVRQIDKRSA